MIDAAQQKRMLQEAGYVVLQVEPARWRVRGPFGFCVMWLADCLYRSEYSSVKPKRYDPEEVVAAARRTRTAYRTLSTDVLLARRRTYGKLGNREARTRRGKQP